MALEEVFNSKQEDGKRCSHHRVSKQTPWSHAACAQQAMGMCGGLVDRLR